MYVIVLLTDIIYSGNKTGGKKIHNRDVSQFFLSLKSLFFNPNSKIPSTPDTIRPPSRVLFTIPPLVWCITRLIQMHNILHFCCVPFISVILSIYLSFAPQKNLRMNEAKKLNLLTIKIR